MNSMCVSSNLQVNFQIIQKPSLLPKVILTQSLTNLHKTTTKSFTNQIRNQSNLSRTQLPHNRNQLSQKPIPCSRTLSEHTDFNPSLKSNSIPTHRILIIPYHNQITQNQSNSIHISHKLIQIQ